MPKLMIRDWIKENLEIETVRQVVLEGCASGCVGDLIYYKDTEAFHDAHEDEIWNLLDQDAGVMGCTIMELIAQFNGQKHVGSLCQLKNLLTWYAVESVCRDMLETE